MEPYPRVSSNRNDKSSSLSRRDRIRKAGKATSSVVFIIIIINITIIIVIVIIIINMYT